MMCLIYIRAPGVANRWCSIRHVEWEIYQMGSEAKMGVTGVCNFLSLSAGKAMVYT
jgi:hypothetical protein